MYKKIFAIIACFATFESFGDTVFVADPGSEDLIQNATELFNATKIVCSNISDDISKVSKVSKVNTAVTAVGTAASGGALVAGLKKSQEEKQIDELIDKMCKDGGCNAETVRAMDLDEFYTKVMVPFSEIATLQEKLERSKKLGNWRTGLMAGTIGTNLASAILSGVNTNQSDLIQHIEACNSMIASLSNVSAKLRAAGVSPIDNPIVNKIDSARTWCTQINTKDVEKIENRMKGVMGTSIAGVVIGGVGTTTSAMANSDKYMNTKNRLSLTDEEKTKEKRLNTTANIMAGANIGTGLVETGLNISLITLTKKMMRQAEQCEDIFK